MMHIHPDRLVDAPVARPTLLNLPISGCRWPLGDPRSSSFGFCGAPAHGRYCPVHAARGRAAVQPGPAVYGVEGLGAAAEPVRFASYMDRWA